MAKLGSSDILPLIHTYLLEIGLEKIAKKLAKASGQDLQSEVQPFFFYFWKKILIFLKKSGIASKKLLKICKFYLKHHPYERSFSN